MIQAMLISKQLPIYGSVLDHISTYQKGWQAGDVPNQAGPTDAAGILLEDEEQDADGVDQRHDGILNIGDPVHLEAQEVRETANGIFNGLREPGVLTAPLVGNHPINKHTPGYMSLAFPALIPNGTSDFCQLWLQKVGLGEYFGHPLWL